MQPLEHYETMNPNKGNLLLVVNFEVAFRIFEVGTPTRKKARNIVWDSGISRSAPVHILKAYCSLLTIMCCTKGGKGRCSLVDWDFSMLR